jgi:hypothetical protein
MCSQIVPCGRPCWRRLAARRSRSCWLRCSGDPSLDGLAELIRERAGGTPFFIEEVVQGLAEEGVLDGNRGA